MHTICMPCTSFTRRCSLAARASNLTCVHAKYIKCDIDHSQRALGIECEDMEGATCATCHVCAVCRALLLLKVHSEGDLNSMQEVSPGVMVAQSSCHGGSV